MSVDERILDALEIDAGFPDVADVDVAFGRVTRATKTRRVGRRVMVATAAALVALALAVIVPAVLERAGPSRTPVAPNPAVSIGSVPAGTFEGAVVPSDRRFGIHGRFRLIFRTDGTAELRGGSGMEEAFTFTPDEQGLLTISLWSDGRCRGLPDGRWSFGARATDAFFSLVHDACPARRWLLLEGDNQHPWVILSR